MSEITKQARRTGTEIQKSLTLPRTSSMKTTSGLTGQFKSVNKEMNQTKTHVNGLKKDFESFGKTAQQNLNNIKYSFLDLRGVIIGLGLAKLLKSSITEAMQAPETENLFRVSWGQLADDAEKFANALSKAFGLDSLEIKKQLGVLQNFITTMGIGADTAATMSKSLTYLAYEISSLYNISVEDAFTKITSGLAGEIEPLRRLGILVDQNTLKQIAYANGIAEAGKELTQQQKVLSTYMALLQQTSNAQGDLARTINSPVNQMRVFQSALREASRELGTAFIPFLQAVTPIAIAATKSITFLLNQINKMVFSMAGLNYSDYIQQQKYVDTGTQKIIKSTNQLGEEAKKTKDKLTKMLLPFDELISLTQKQDEGLDGTGNIFPGDFGEINMPSLEPPKDVELAWTALFEKIKSQFWEFYDWYKRYETQIQAITKGIAQGFMTYRAIKLFPNLIPTLKNMGRGFKDLFTNIRGGQSTLKNSTTSFKNLGTQIKNNGGGIKGTIKTFKNLVTQIGRGSSVMTILGGLFKAVPGWGWAVAGVTTAVAGLTYAWKEARKPMIEIPNIMDGISSATRETVGPFLELSYSADTTFKQIAWSGATITEEMATNVTNKYKSMSDNIVNTLDEQRNKSTTVLSEFFTTATGITEDQKLKILELTNQSYDQQKITVEQGQARITEIMSKASKERRSLTEEEKQEINRIQIEMNTIAIKNMADTSEEQELILSRLKDNATKISAQQAAEIVKNSIKAREESIDNAHKKYNALKKESERLRELGTEEAIKAADDLLREAERQKRETIDKAEEMHRSVVEEAKAQAREHIDEVDWETGQILNRWESMLRRIRNMFNEMQNKARQARNYTDEKWGVSRAVTRTIQEQQRQIAVNYSDLPSTEEMTVSRVSTYSRAVPDYKVTEYANKALENEQTINTAVQPIGVMTNQLQRMIDLLSEIATKNPEFKLHLGKKELATELSPAIDKARSERGVSI